MYKIESKSDFRQGATLSVRVPEEDIDYKALYTIMADKPDFLLPFQYRTVDDYVELTFQIGRYSKLLYTSGKREVAEYVRLWSTLLEPLMSCEDWFLTPQNFVLDMEYLYLDGATGYTGYVYLPTKTACATPEMLTQMITTVAKENRVTDIALENKVIWALQDFNLEEFLSMVKGFVKAAPKANIVPVEKQMSASHVVAPVVDSVVEEQPKLRVEPMVVKEPAQEVGMNLGDDIVINFDGNMDENEKKAAKKGLFGKAEKKAKAPKEEKIKPEKKPLFGKKKPTEKEIIRGAAVEENIKPAYPVAYTPIPVQNPMTSHQEDYNDATQIEEDITKTGLRYVGTGSHPRTIEVTNPVGSVFSIGRFDASVGVKQSDFEFPKSTKAISRRHAVIEHKAEGYYLVDVGSSAGTFLDGQKLPLNAPFLIARGQRIGFGNNGADYIWEE